MLFSDWLNEFLLYKDEFIDALISIVFLVFGNRN